MTAHPTGTGTGTGTDVRALVEGLWQRFQPLASRRVAALEAWVAAADGGPGRVSGDLSATSLRDAAAAAAHDLAGSLGSYGRPEGSRLAEACEASVDSPGPGLRDLVVRLRAEVGP